MNYSLLFAYRHYSIFTLTIQYTKLLNSSHRQLNPLLLQIHTQCVVSVSNKAFEEYFGHIVDTLLEVVAPQDKERLINFIDNYDGTAKSGMFKFINARGEERYNHLFVYQQHGAGNEHMRDIELVDVESIEETNKSLRDDVTKHKMLLGLDREYTFTYNRDNNIFSMYRYDVDSRDIIYKADIDDWKKRMLSEGYIEKSDKEMFTNFISEVRSYTQTFSTKFKTSMRRSEERRVGKECRSRWSPYH